MTAKSSKKTSEQLPLMPLRSTIVYPLGVIGVQIGMPTTLEMLARHPDESLRAVLVVAPGGPDEPIEPGSLEKIGVTCRLSDRLNMPGGTIQATVQGIERVQLRDVRFVDGYFTGSLEPAVDIPMPESEAQELITRILTTLEALAAEVDRIAREVPRILRMNVADPGRFADLVATLANFSVGKKDEVLQLLDVRERLSFVLTELEGELVRLRQVEQATEGDAEQSERQPMNAAERAADLRKRIKRLQADLGEVDPIEREVVDLLRKIEMKQLPPAVAAQARNEVERLRSAPVGSADAGEIRSYIDWLLAMPWNRDATDGAEGVDLAGVREALDENLIGLADPKDRLLDYLAVARLRADLKGPIPCFVGPPGVGKSAVAAALAAGLGRPLARLEMGGKGEAQLIGARRTRSGATAGKIAGALRDVGVADPVFLLEEMDEIGLGKVEGDPIEAMEEALDWENRHAFIDRYLDVPFDLSRALFIATAQDFFRIPRDLRELMVEIRLAGYTPEDKVRIAREKLVPKLIREHGLEPEDIEFPDEVLQFIARGYARDAGLDTMARIIAAILRTRARAKAEGEAAAWQLDGERIEKILGLPRYVATPAESAPEVGVVTGLAWTAAGGELMFIEALKMPGTGRLIITGLLGDVMRESVNAAFSYVRSRADDLGILATAFKECDVHVHFPVGAIPKDGPSAGVAVTLALASSLSNRSVRHDIAMTGEVTLRGKILEIGGVKEKVLAAHRAGVLDVILPRGNERDLRDVPDDVRTKMTFHLVERMDDVLQLALLDGTQKRRRRTKLSSGSARDAEEPAPQPRAARG